MLEILFQVVLLKIMAKSCLNLDHDNEEDLIHDSRVRTMLNYRYNQYLEVENRYLRVKVLYLNIESN